MRVGRRFANETAEIQRFFYVEKEAPNYQKSKVCHARIKIEKRILRDIIRIDSRSARTEESKETRKRGTQRTQYVSIALTKLTQESDALSRFEIAPMEVVGPPARVGRRFANETAEIQRFFI
ncbi:hypothetical protein [Lysinibacillus telephonicus]|uniref:hypothetical protein n=1 Tax=Lysinibacillus telephonicus TaxID=1714840 RepID=UPI003BA177D0